MESQSPTRTKSAEGELAFMRSVASKLTRNAHDADDLAQSAWVALLKSSPSEIRYPRAFLRQVLSRLWCNELRLRRSNHVDQSDEPCLDLDSEPGALVAGAEQRVCIRTLIDELAPHYARVVRMHYLEGMTTVQIAETLGLQVETVRTRRKRGLRKLRPKLERDLGEWNSAGSEDAP